MTTESSGFRRPRPTRSQRDATTLAQYEPPASIAAEQSVLGAMLIEPEAIDCATEKLQAWDFYRDAHQVIFDVLASLHRDGVRADSVTVEQTLKDRGQHEFIGGAAYLMALLDTVPTAANVSFYADIVKEKSQLRRIIEAAMETIGLCRGEDPAAQIMDRSLSMLFAVSEGAGEREGGVSYKDALSATYDEVERRAGIKHENPHAMFGIPTGISLLDHILMGMGDEELIILAARPGMGKTAGLLGIAEHAASHGNKTQIFSMEMSRDQIGVRFLASGSRTDSTRMMRGDSDHADFERMEQFIASRYSGDDQLPIWIDDATGLTIGQIRARARRCKRRRGLDLVIVDYLQLASGDKGSHNRSEEIGQVAMGLKNLARELHVPVLCAAQLNRAADSRTDKRPQMSDLRESGNIEQEADKILFLYRDDYYDIKPGGESYQEERGGEGHHPILPAEIIIGKNRHGERSIVKVGWQPTLGKFVNLETHREESEAPPSGHAYSPGPPMAGNYEPLSFDDEE